MPVEENEEVLAVRALQRHVTRHNWQALLLAFLSLAVAALLWSVIYVFVYWFALVLATLSVSFNPDTLLEATNPDLLGRCFPAEFAVGAALALLLATFLGRWVNPVKLRERRLYVLWVFYELFMAVPNVTFSIWGNLRAIVRLRPDEALAAWRLLDRVRALGGRLRLASLAAEIDEHAALPHILLVLQIAELLGVRENEGGWFYYVQNQEAFAKLTPARPTAATSGG